MNSAVPKTSDVVGGSGAMFDRIAKRYDLLNRVLSLGIDQSWRREMVAQLELPENARVLDIATGTGDVAFAIKKARPASTIIGVDPSLQMLAIAKQKASAQNLTNCQFEAGGAESLPFAPGSFDGVTIAFGIRNVPDRSKALREMARVCKPSGRICVLELSEPKIGVLGRLASFHVHHVVPRIGALLSGKKEYRYLQTSIAAFPAPPDFMTLMESAGLNVRMVKKFSFGVCHLYVAQPKALLAAPRQESL